MLDIEDKFLTDELHLSFTMFFDNFENFKNNIFFLDVFKAFLVKLNDKICEHSFELYDFMLIQHFKGK